MIKILWNQCEAETEQETTQCERVGSERTFADGAKATMCSQHWLMCTGIVDKDGAKHVKGEGEPVG